MTEREWVVVGETERLWCVWLGGGGGGGRPSSFGMQDGLNKGTSCCGCACSMKLCPAHAVDSANQKLTYCYVAWGVMFDGACPLCPFAVCRC